jgi:hypothetical protein
MPSDDVLRFAGPMLGNNTTCQIQGFFILFGLAGGEHSTPVYLGTSCVGLLLRWTHTRSKND